MWTQPPPCPSHAVVAVVPVQVGDATRMRTIVSGRNVVHVKQTGSASPSAAVEAGKQQITTKARIMRQSKYDKPLLPQENIGNSDGKRQVTNFENRVELGAEGDRLAELLGEVKELMADVQNFKDALDDAKAQCRIAVSSLSSSAAKANGSAVSFDKSIERLGKIRIDCNVSEEDEKKLKEQSKSLFEGEKALLTDYLNEIRKSHIQHWADIKKIVKSNDGISLTGWTAKFAVISYFFFYVYFLGTFVWYLFVR